MPETAMNATPGAQPAMLDRMIPGPLGNSDDLHPPYLLTGTRMGERRLI